MAMANAVVDGLAGRVDGPMAVRFLLQPTVAAILGIRAGLRDARLGKPPFLHRMALEPGDRGTLAGERRADVGKLFLIAMALDLVYQATVLGAFRPVGAVAVALLLAIIPYTIIRAASGRIMSRRRSLLTDATVAGDPELSPNDVTREDPAMKQPK